MFAALVGPGQQENLATAYLASNAQKAGHRVERLRFDSSDDLRHCVEQVQILKPDLVGISIPFQYAITQVIELAQALRQSGFQGHLTCGGHVPTFCYDSLLADAPAIDTVVRHEGEETLVEMLDALSAGKPLQHMAGLVWREDNQVVVGPVRGMIRHLDALPIPERNHTPYTAGGVPMAFALASRGCIGECAYCCIRAFNKGTGGPSYRLRSPENVAEELARLYYLQGVRMVLLQDDLFILPSPRKTIARMEAIRDALHARGVKNMLFWIKGRPETITREVLQTARTMGAVHLFLGIENHSAERLAYLGRQHTPKDSERAIQLCFEEKITPSFNIMLFDPDSTIADVEKNLAFARRYPMLTWNICRTEIYPGTELYTRLQKDGRLRGDYRALGYTISDPSAELMFRIVRVVFMQRCLSADALHNQLITLGFARQLHAALLPGPGTDAYSAKVDQLINDINNDTLDTLCEVARFSKDADMADVEAVRKFAVNIALQVNERGHQWQAAVQETATMLSARGDKIRMSVPY